MAGFQLNKKVRASTLMEVVVSMVIIVLVFGIAMMIYTNVTRVSLSAKKIRAQMILNETMIKAAQNQQSITQTLTIDDFRVEQVVSPYANNTLLTDIRLTAFDQNQKKIAELEKIIY